MKQLLVALIALLMTMAAIAEGNSIYIEDFMVCPDSTVVVPVMLANTDSTRGIQFNLTLPDGLDLTKCELTPYSEKRNMNLFKSKKDRTCVMGLYPMGIIYFQPDTAAIMSLQFKAQSSFKGGEIIVWKCRGSSSENKNIPFADDTTNVTVPLADLIGIPIENQSDGNSFFNLQVPLTHE